MKIPEIQRDLDGNVHPKVIYHMQRMQETILHQAHQLDEAAKILVMVVKTLENVQRVNVQLAERWENRLLGGDANQDIVQSVIPDPED